MNDASRWRLALARKIAPAYFELPSLQVIYHPGFKWLDRLAAEMHAAPPDLAPRLKQLFRLVPRVGARSLQALIEEMLALVDAHMPEVETAQARARLSQQRAIWTAAPAGVLEDHPPTTRK